MCVWWVCVLWCVACNVWVCVCVGVCVWVFGVCVWVCMFVLVCVCVWVCVWVGVCVGVCVWVCLWVCVGGWVCGSVCICVFVAGQSRLTSRSLRTPINLYSWFQKPAIFSQNFILVYFISFKRIPRRTVVNNILKINIFYTDSTFLSGPERKKS